MDENYMLKLGKSIETAHHTNIYIQSYNIAKERLLYIMEYACLLTNKYPLLAVGSFGVKLTIIEELSEILNSPLRLYDVSSFGQCNIGVGLLIFW